jgi:hypothetical protein
VDGTDALEGRVPDRVGHLRSQQRSAHCPQTISIGRHVAPPPLGMCRFPQRRPHLWKRCTRT